MFEADFSEKDRNSQVLSQENGRFLALVEQGIRHCEDGHYELPLPLNESSASLPNNHEVALRRLSQLKRRIKSDQKYKEDYTTFMENLIKNGMQKESHLTNVYSKEVLKTASQVYLIKEKFGIFLITAYIIPKSQTRSGWFSIAPRNARTRP